VCNGSLLVQRQANCERSREADQCKHNVPLGQIAANPAVFQSAFDYGLHEFAGSGTKVGPITFFEERVDHIDHTNPNIERRVHVPAKRVHCVWYVFNKRLSGTDAFFQCLTSNGVQEGLLIREVSIESSNPNPGAFCNSIPRRFTAHLQYQLDRGIEQSLPILLSIRTHLVYQS